MSPFCTLQSSGTLLAPVQAPLGNLAPLRGLAASPAGILRGSLNSDVGSSVDSSLVAKGGMQPAETCKPTDQTKKLLGLVCEQKSSLNTAGLDKGRNDEEESENESLHGTARLFKNLHMDVSALGGSFDSELSKASETSDCGDDLQASNRSDRELIQPMDLGFQSRLSEQVLDVGVLSPVLDGPTCKVSAIDVVRDRSVNRQGKILCRGALITG